MSRSKTIVGVTLVIAALAACVAIFCGANAFAADNATDANNKASTDIHLYQGSTKTVDTDGDGVPDSESLEGVVFVPAKIVGVVAAKDGAITYPTAGLTITNRSAFNIHVSSMDYTEPDGSPLAVVADPGTGTLANGTYYTKVNFATAQSLDFKALTAKSSTVTKDRVVVKDKKINIVDTLDFALTGKANTKGIDVPTTEETALQLGTLSWWFGDSLLS